MRHICLSMPLWAQASVLLLFYASVVYWKQPCPEMSMAGSMFCADAAANDTDTRHAVCRPTYHHHFTQHQSSEEYTLSITTSSVRAEAPWRQDRQAVRRRGVQAMLGCWCSAT